MKKKEEKRTEKTIEKKDKIKTEKEQKSSLEKTSEKTEKEKEHVVNKNLKGKQNKQIVILIVLMAVIILFLFWFPGVIRGFFNSFDYAGLKFEKTKQGEIAYYSTYIPITDKNYNTIGNYPINFRLDPRKLDYVDLKISDNKISFIRENQVYISVDSDSPRCEYNAVAAATLAAFLNGFGGLNVAGALDDKDMATPNIPYVTCKTNPMNTVISLEYGNETKIEKISNNCYKLTYKDCEILDVTEKFQMTIIENYMDVLKEKTSKLSNQTSLINP